MRPVVGGWRRQAASWGGRPRDPSANCDLSELQGLGVVVPCPSRPLCPERGWNLRSFLLIRGPSCGKTPAAPVPELSRGDPFLKLA